VESDWVLARPSFNGAPLLDRIAKGESLAAVTGALAPSDPKYKELRAALARYAHFAADGGWPLVPGLADDSVANNGPRRAQAGYAILRRRLAMEGLAGEDGDLTAAIRLFQARHGIDIDGTIGRQTLEALNVGAAQRADQLRLALERLRAMPRDWPATRLVVNIPSATLALYRDGKVALVSRVVVGDPNHPTPVLGSAISSVLFNPPWTVPASIVRKEIQPRLLKDPGYLARNHFKLLGRGDGSSDGIDWSNTDILANGWQVQQQPGPWNALGRLMFDFPSPFAVYLHDTPGRSAFARSDRGLSHGCVRVEAANALAGAMLGAEGSPEAIQKIVAGGQTERHPLKQPMPVYLVYMTAFVDEENGVEFRDDLYSRDQRLAAALSAHKPPEPRVALGASR
jgi:murein L,D-transpeptidase YcbB/YkuD